MSFTPRFRRLSRIVWSAVAAACLGCAADAEAPAASGDLDATDDADHAPGETEAETTRWGFALDHPLFAEGLRNVAHRGGGRLAPEESLAAYENAARIGADMLEMDLHATADGVVVLHHDAAVDRVTDGAGLIKDMTLEQLRQLDAGFRFSPDGGATFPFRGTGVTVATFREVLERFPDQVFSAEIKQREPMIVDAVLAVLAETGMEDRVIVVSFFDDVMQEVRRKNPRIVTGAATAEMAELSLLTEEAAAAYVPPCPYFQLPNAGRALVDRIHRFGGKVQIWTVNDVETMRAWLALGVDGVMTDNPALLETVLQEIDG